MALVYRGNGAWGTGKGANLTAAEFDGNTWDLDQRIVALETNPAAPVEISNITQSGTTVTIHLSNGTTYNVSFATSSTVLAADIIEVGGTLFTPGLVNANAYHRCTNAGGCAVTIPLNADVAFPVKTELHFRQSEAGAVTIAGDTGVTINVVDGYTAETQAQGGVITAKKVSLDEWDLFGNLLSI